jgi:hypothetical protein
LPLFFAKGLQPLHKLIEVHFMAIELRAFHAGEQDSFLLFHPAASAHSCTVNHDGLMPILKRKSE